MDQAKKVEGYFTANQELLRSDFEKAKAVMETVSGCEDKIK